MQTCLDGVKRFRNHWIKSILTIANKNPDLLLIIKPHPLEIARTRIHGSEAYENFFCNTANILYLQENYHIIPLLQEVGALIHYGSTCAAFAYRYHIYNIYVEYPELFEIAKTEKGLISFNDIRLGGDTRLHLRNLPEFVKKNKNKFTITSNQHTLDTLKSFFGYSDLQKILPSKTIAHILLSKNDFPYQEINNSIDKYFFQLEALPHIAHSINILKELLNIYKTQKQEDYIMRTKEALQRIATLVNSL